MQQYVCPMDPDVIRESPGECPKCGMNLVPLHSDGEAHREGHLNMEQNFKKRFFASLPLIAVILFLSPKIQQWFHYSFTFTGMEIILFILATFIVFWAASPFYQMAKGEISTRNFGMMTLVSLAVLSGYIFSVAATFLFTGEALYWEVSTLVLAFLFGHWMEMRAVRGATGALSELAKLIPPSAHKIVGKNIQDVKTEDLQIGDLILVKPGEKIPMDGVVLEGESSVNEAMVTGESAPVSKAKEDQVIGGTINSDGSLTIKISKIGKNTAISQMMELIRKAQETKPSVQKLADRAAKYLTFIAIFVGSATFIFWFFIFPQGPSAGSGEAAIFASTLAIAVIVIACPHALGLAIPTVSIVTTTLAAKNGILIKDMKALEIARKLDYVVFDKTGTLTKGEFGMVETTITNNNLLGMVAAVETYSQHSIAQSIVNEVQKRGFKIPKLENFKSYPGRGASGKINENEIVVGNARMMEQIGIDQNELATLKTKKAGTLVYVALRQAQGKQYNLAGVIVLADLIREESKEAIESLHNMGIKTAMLTGDREEVAEDVGKKLIIDTIFAQVLPEEKVSKIKQLQKDGHIVAMVGDGVNDAASLTQSNIGIAIGAGTGVAIESAQIVLMQNDPRAVVKAIRLSQKTNTKMVQNLAWAAGYNLIAMPVAAGILFPFGIFLRPEWSALIMSASSIIVVSNALLLRRENLN